MTSDMNKQAPARVLPKKRKKSVSLDRKKARAGWLFVLPFIIGLVLIYLPVMFNSIRLSFVTLTLNSSGYTMAFNPADPFINYRWAFTEHTWFFDQLLSTLGSLARDIPAIVIFALFMALLLNQDMKGRAVFRAIFFVPVILSTGNMESIEAGNVFGEGGSINTGEAESTTDQIVSVMDMESLFENLMVGQELAMYVTQLINNIFGIVNRSGVQMLIFLAGLQSISPAIYESCQIDGATSWETFWKITFPMISPMILVNAVYTVIDSFTLQDNVVMSWIGGLNDVTDGVSDVTNGVDDATNDITHDKTNDINDKTKVTKKPN